MNNYKSQNKGFTLVELLVVISIISLLSSVILSSLSTARMNARDAKRISDIRQIRIALEQYRNTNGTYPTITSWVSSVDTDWNTTGALKTALSPYMTTLPRDPVNNSGTPWVNGSYSYAYYYNPALYTIARSYDLLGQLENTSSPLIASIKLWIFHVVELTWVSQGYSNYLYTGEF